ncbi:hypothetical protein D3C81_1002290 [compost metagenome]
MCPLVGASVEFAVAQLLVQVGDGNRLRTGSGLGSDQGVQTVFGRELGRLWVPLGDLRSDFVGAEQLQCGYALLRVGDHGSQKIEPVPGHALDGGGVEQVSGVGQRGAQTVAAFLGIQGQVELRRGALQRQLFDLDPGKRCGALPTHVTLVVEHHLEQRAVAEVALRLQRFDQLLERQVLVPLGIEHRLLHLGQQATESQCGIELGLEHLGVDEIADQPLGFTAAAVGGRGADTDIRLTAVALQQGLERRQ